MMRNLRNFLLYSAAAALLVAGGCGRKPAETSGEPAPNATAPANPPEGQPPAAQQPSTAPPQSPGATPASERAATARPGERGDSSPLTPAPAKEATPRSITLPEGTAIRVRTTSTLSTKTSQDGDTFTATLMKALVEDGVTVAPRGATVTGKVVNADPGGRVKGRASIAVTLTSLETAGGKTVSIDTSTYGAAAASTKKKDALKVGIGSGLGAAIGAIAGGGKGAAIGAAAGAGAGGGAVLATRGEAAVIPAETAITFKLTAPVKVR